MKTQASVVFLFSLSSFALAGSTAFAQYGHCHGSPHVQYDHAGHHDVVPHHNPIIDDGHHFDVPIYPHGQSNVYNAPIYPNAGYGETCPYVYCDLEAAETTLPNNSFAGSSSTEGERFRQLAQQAFRAGDFRSASRFANHALIELPNDGQLVAFFAQTLFAVSDYRGAASVIHDAANILDPAQLGAVVETHRQHPTYVEQMQRLDQFIAANPDSPDALFTRGFQLGFNGERDAAVRDLNQANRFVPNDPLTLALIDAFDSGIVPPLLEPSQSLSSDAPIVMDGPPPTIDSSAPAPRPSVSVDGQDHSGHDHPH